MPAAAPIVAAVLVSAIGTAVSANQQKKAAEGAANAASDRKKEMDRQIADQKAADKNLANNKSTTAGISQQAALNAIRASMTTQSAAGGSILSGPQGATAAPVQGKTLLGI